MRAASQLSRLRFGSAGRDAPRRGPQAHESYIISVFSPVNGNAHDDLTFGHHTPLSVCLSLTVTLNVN